MRKKKYLFLLLAFVLVMAGVTVFGENGLFHVFRLKRELKKLNETNQLLRNENTDLLEEIEHLRFHKGYLEMEAHKQGLVKDGEIVFQFGEDQ
jgi:cell division protein FtsB